MYVNICTYVNVFKTAIVAINISYIIKMQIKFNFRQRSERHSSNISHPDEDFISGVRKNLLGFKSIRKFKALFKTILTTVLFFSCPLKP